MIEELESKDAQIAQIEDEKIQVVIKLDEAGHWSSIKRQEKITGKTFQWRSLKKYSNNNGFEIKKAFDQSYGEVNSYCAEVWLGVYDLDIGEIK